MSGNGGSAPACAFVIFGVTGDLTERKLMPALYQLHVHGSLHEESVIIGHARSELTDETLRRRMAEALEREVPGFDPVAWQALAPRLHYIRGAYDQPEGFEKLAALLDELGLPGRVFYTATPPAVYEDIARGLDEAGLTTEPEGGFARLVVEKPFGFDLLSAKELNSALLARFREHQLFRIDHYLAKETAQNLAVLRFANTMFEPLWNNAYIDNVQISPPSILETLLGGHHRHILLLELPLALANDCHT